MPYFYKIVPDNYAYVKAIEIVTLKNIAEITNSLFYDSLWVPGLPIFCDYLELEKLKISAGEMQYVAKVHSGQTVKLIGDGKLAFVIQRTSVFGLHRMWLELVQGLEKEVEFFRDFSEAEKWFGFQIDNSNLKPCGLVP